MMREMGGMRCMLCGKETEFPLFLSRYSNAGERRKEVPCDHCGCKNYVG